MYEPEVSAFNEKQATSGQICEIFELGGNDHVQRHDKGLDRVNSFGVPSDDVIGARADDFVFNQPIWPLFVTSRNP